MHVDLNVKQRADLFMISKQKKRFNTLIYWLYYLPKALTIITIDMHVIILVKPILEIKEAYLQVNKFYKKKTRKLIQMRVLKPNSRKRK